MLKETNPFKILFQFMNLWTEYTELKRANAQDDVLATVQKLHEEN